MGTARGASSSTRHGVTATTPRARKPPQPAGHSPATVGSSPGDMLKKLQRELTEAVADLEEQEAKTSNEIRGLRQKQKAEARKVPHFHGKEDKKDVGTPECPESSSSNSRSDKPETGNVAHE